MDDADANPFASPTEVDEASPADDRPRLPGRPVFLPMSLAPVVTAATLPLSIAAVVGIGQLMPAGTGWPRRMPDASETMPMLGVAAGASSAVFAVLVVPAVWWFWRRRRLTQQAIYVGAVLAAALGLVAPPILLAVAEPDSQGTPLIFLIGVPLLFGLPQLTPVLLYAWWLNRLATQADKSAPANH